MEENIKYLLADFESKQDYNNYLLDIINDLREIKETYNLKYEEHDLAIINAINELYNLGKIIYDYKEK